MYYRDHAPPHFHATYGDYDVTVTIETGVVEGRFPRRALSALLDWTALHQTELMRNWDAARREEPLNKIEPLE
jgi:hypothetical protein